MKQRRTKRRTKRRSRKLKGGAADYKIYIGDGTNTIPVNIDDLKRRDLGEGTFIWKDIWGIWKQLGYTGDAELTEVYQKRRRRKQFTGETFAIGQNVEGEYSTNHEWKHATVVAYNPGTDTYTLHFSDTDEEVTLPASLVRNVQSPMEAWYKRGAPAFVEVDKLERLIARMKRQAKAVIAAQDYQQEVAVSETRKNLPTGLMHGYTADGAALAQERERSSSSSREWEELCNDFTAMGFTENKELNRDADEYFEPGPDAQAALEGGIGVIITGPEDASRTDRESEPWVKLLFVPERHGLNSAGFFIKTSVLREAKPTDEGYNNLKDHWAFWCKRGAFAKTDDGKLGLVAGYPNHINQVILLLVGSAEPRQYRAESLIQANKREMDQAAEAAAKAAADHAQATMEFRQKHKVYMDDSTVLAAAGIFHRFDHPAWDMVKYDINMLYKGGEFAVEFDHAIEQATEAANLALLPMHQQQAGMYVDKLTMGLENLLLFFQKPEIIGDGQVWAHIQQKMIESVKEKNIPAFLKMVNNSYHPRRSMLNGLIAATLLEERCLRLRLMMGTGGAGRWGDEAGEIEIKWKWEDDSSGPLGLGVLDKLGAGWNTCSVNVFIDNMRNLAEPNLTDPVSSGDVVSRTKERNMNRAVRLCLITKNLQKNNHGIHGYTKSGKSISDIDIIFDHPYMAWTWMAAASGKKSAYLRAKRWGKTQKTQETRDVEQGEMIKYHTEDKRDFEILKINQGRYSEETDVAKAQFSLPLDQYREPQPDLESGPDVAAAAAAAAADEEQAELPAERGQMEQNLADQFVLRCFIKEEEEDNALRKEFEKSDLSFRDQAGEKGLEPGAIDRAIALAFRVAAEGGEFYGELLTAFVDLIILRKHPSRLTKAQRLEVAYKYLERHDWKLEPAVKEYEATELKGAQRSAQSARLGFVVDDHGVQATAVKVAMERKIREAEEALRASSSTRPWVGEDATVVEAKREAKQNAEKAANKAGWADQEMPVGTRIWVKGRGLGSYSRFESRGLFAKGPVPNDHFIQFDGELAESKVKLKGEEWTVKQNEMDEMVRIEEGEKEKKWEARRNLPTGWLWGEEKGRTYYYQESHPETIQWNRPEGESRPRAPSLYVPAAGKAAASDDQPLSLEPHNPQAASTGQAGPVAAALVKEASPEGHGSPDVQTPTF